MNDAEKLCQLVQLYLDGKPLPDVEGIPVIDWLALLRSDQTPFNTALAARLDMQSDPPWTGEAAMTLRARLQSAL